MNTIINFPTTVTCTSPPLTPPKAKVSRKRSAPTIHPDDNQDKKKRKSRIVYKFDKPFLSQYFHMPQKQAAEVIGVSVITIKRCCSREGFRWPFRANKYKNGNKPVRSKKGQAFHRLPLDCLKVEDEAATDGDTDTESVDDDELVKKDYGQLLISLHKTPINPELLCTNWMQV